MLSPLILCPHFCPALLQKFNEGVTIFNEGDVATEFFLLIEGSARVVNFDVSLKHLVEAGRLGAGDYFGETALLRNEKRTATVIASTPCTCMVLSKDRFRALFGDDGGFPLPFAQRRQGLAAPVPHALDSELKRPAKPVHIMSSESRSMLLAALSQCPLFAGSTVDDRLALVQSMFAVDVPVDKAVVTQGDLGTQLYCVESGAFTVRQISGDGAVHTVGSVGPGGYFGELALLNSAPRAATVIATAPSVVWVLDRFTWTTLTKAMGAQKLEKRVNFLRNIEFLAPLTEFERRRIAEAMDEVFFAPNSTVFSKGDSGNAMYIVVSGSIIVPDAPSEAATDAAAAVGGCTSVTPSGELVLGSGAYFGELALLFDRPRAASAVTRAAPAECLTLDAHTFKVLLGPVVDYLVNQAAKYGGDRSMRRPEVKALALPSTPTEALSRSPTAVPAAPAAAAAAGAAALGGNEGVVVGGTVSSSHYAHPAAATTLTAPAAAAAGAGAGAVRNTAVSGGPIRSTSRPINSLSDLSPVATLGKGSFGFVRLVRDRAGNSYALKAVNKQQIVATQQQHHILSEKWVLSTIRHPFVIRLYATYKTQNKLYFLLEPVLGGELFTFLRAQHVFPEPWVAFYGAAVVSVFETLHSHAIAYRDLKPENLLLDARGYLKVTDFGFAKEVGDGKTWTLCGTPDYLAPEIVASRGHGTGVDWWTLGVLLYEMLAAFPPFYEEDPMKTYTRIVEGAYSHPAHFSPRARSLISALLEVRTSRRLGCGGDGAAGVRAHPFFAQIDFARLLAKELPAPHVPVSAVPVDDPSRFAHSAALVEEEVPYVDDGSNWEADF